MEDDSFVQAIVESPFDESLRLQYAKWLEERGDPRAEYLHIEATFRALPQDAPEVRAGYTRWPELRKTLDPRWLLMMDRRVATPPGVGPEGRQAIEAIRGIFIAAKEISTCYCKAFYSPGEWKKQGHRIPAETGSGERPVLVVVYSGGMIGGCFDGFDSEQFEVYLKLPEDQRIRIYPPVLVLRRQITDAFNKLGLVCGEWNASTSLVCTKSRPVARTRAKRK